MATASQLVLPGSFEPGKTYLMTGATLLAWKNALLADRVIPGPGLTEQGTPQGRIFKTTPSEAAEPLFNFARVYTDPATGNTLLQGGTVSPGSVTVAPYVLRTAGTSPPADGTHATLHIHVTANEDDGVLVPGCVISGTPTIDATAPAAGTTPTAGSPAGSLHVSLGHWYGGTFWPASSGGNFNVFHWLSNLHVTHL